MEFQVAYSTLYFHIPSLDNTGGPKLVRFRLVRSSTIVQIPQYSTLFACFFRKTAFVKISFTYIFSTNPLLVRFRNTMIPWEHKICTMYPGTRCNMYCKK